MKLLLEESLTWPLSTLQLDGFIFILDFTGFTVCLLVLDGILEVLRLMLLPRVFGLAPNVDLAELLLGTLLLERLPRMLASVIKPGRELDDDALGKLLVVERPSDKLETDFRRTFLELLFSSGILLETDSKERRPPVNVVLTFLTLLDSGFRPLVILLSTFFGGNTTPDFGRMTCLFLVLALLPEVLDLELTLDLVLLVDSVDSERCTFEVDLELVMVFLLEAKALAAGFSLGGASNDFGTVEDCLNGGLDVELEGLDRAIFNIGDFVLLGVFPIVEDLLARSISLGAGLGLRDS